MSEYTPTTGHIRDFWATGGTYIPAAKGQSYEECFSEFDRWLAKHDAEVAGAERERIIVLLKSHIYSQANYVCSCQIDDDYPNTMGVDEWVEHICTYQGERMNE